MRPLNFIALLLFLTGLVWVFTLSESTVRTIQKSYYAHLSPLINKGTEAEQYAKNFVKEAEHSEDLQRRLDLALRERDRFKLIASRVRELELASNELRGALNFQKKTSFDVVGAQVIRRQPLTWGRTLEINRGARDKIGVSLTVVASNGGFVGKVYQPGDDVSSVILVTDEGFRVSARIEGTTEMGILEGRRTNFGEQPRLRLRHLSKSANVHKGMKVYSDGRGTLFPADIPIGTIEDFESGPVDGEATVIPAVDFQNLKTVFVITGSPET